MPVTVCLASLNAHLHSGFSASVTVVASRLSSRCRERLRRASDTWAQVDLRFVEAPRERLARLPQVGHLTQETYLRLLLPDLLPDLDQVVYLDADLLIQRDLSSLTTFAIRDCPLAAVPDAAMKTNGESEGLSYCFREAALVNSPSKRARTINAGVLVFNLAAWRARGLADDLIAFLLHHADELRWADQDAINAVLGHEIAHLPIEFNVMSLWRSHPPQTVEEAEKVRVWVEHPAAAPVVWHFAGRTKPWKPQSLRSPFRRMYHEALRQSGWFASPAAFAAWQAMWYARNGLRLAGVARV